MMRGQTPQAIQSYLKEEGTLENFKTRVLEEKTLNWVLEHASLVAPELVEPTEIVDNTEDTSSAVEEPQEPVQEDSTQEPAQITPSHNFSMKNKTKWLMQLQLGESASGKTKEQLLAILDKIYNKISGTSS